MDLVEVVTMLVLPVVEGSAEAAAGAVTMENEGVMMEEWVEAKGLEEEVKKEADLERVGVSKEVEVVKERVTVTLALNGMRSACAMVNMTA